MGLINLQRRLAEVGRIRMGEKSGNRPVKRETWRITSRDQARLVAVQDVYGGELRPWNNGGSAEFELLTETDSLNVMVLPGQTLSQWMELWSGGGCQRRCDGERMIVPEDAPCRCPEDHEARAALAQKGQACKATTRLSVLLPDVQGLGCWRLESHGYNAAVELAGVAELLEQATARGVMLPARLRIDQRSSIKNGQTRRFPVPTLEVEATPHEIRQLGSGAAVENRPALPPASPRASLDRGTEPLELERGTTPAAPPVMPDSDAGSVPGHSIEEELAEVATEVVVFLSESQRRKVFAKARAAKLNEDTLRTIIEQATGQSSTAAIPTDKLDEILTAIGGAS